MPDNDLSLIAHLMRRAGFGARRDELEAYSARKYDAVVEDVLYPERAPSLEEDILDRYNGWDKDKGVAASWMYRMVNSERHLEEKIALFWHHVFATGTNKSEHDPSHMGEIEMFRRIGLSDMRTLLIGLSKDPAMIYWLDNNENHKDEPNENYGREILELFSMGVGNYTETDIKMAGRAFTGWTFTQPIPLYPTGIYNTSFVYKEDDHDDSEKTFLGETGCFNGEDIVDIIVKQPATARFISRHMYNFFVADEPQVPAWGDKPPGDPEAIDALVGTYLDSDGDIRSMLRVLFNSDFFKEARFKRVKTPAELVAGVIKLVGTDRFPAPGFVRYAQAATLMGQQLFNPPTVEGWHTGQEWINGGTLNERVNFAVNQVGDASKPGLRDIVDRLGSTGGSVTPAELVDRCLDLVGPLDVSDDARDGLLEYANAVGELKLGTKAEREQSQLHVVRMIQLIVATREYQFA
jgi:uncharacterized protein (DUF1800 family)